MGNVSLTPPLTYLENRPYLKHSSTAGQRAVIKRCSAVLFFSRDKEPIKTKQPMEKIRKYPPTISNATRRLKAVRLEAMECLKCARKVAFYDLRNIFNHVPMFHQ